MLNLSFEETVKNHREMWNWIADETLKREEAVGKWEYFEAYRIILKPECECYACDFASGCHDCPIMWDNLGNLTCLSKNSPYIRWCRSRDNGNYKSAAKWARKIANLPIKRRIHVKNSFKGD